MRTVLGIARWLLDADRVEAAVETEQALEEVVAPDDEFAAGDLVLGARVGPLVEAGLGEHTGGAHIARRGGPLLLTPPTDPPGLSSFTAGYLRGNRATIVELFVYGGSAAVSDSVQVQIQSL